MMKITCPHCGTLKTIEYWDEMDPGIAYLQRHMKRKHHSDGFEKKPNKATMERRRAKIQERLASGELPPASEVLNLKHR